MARDNFRRSRPKEDREFEQSVIDISRVTRVVAGGKRMRFRACVVIGNMKGKIGMGVKKGADVSGAVNKAVAVARKDLFEVKTINETIPHRILQKYKAAKVLLKPAPKGTGLKAGGPVRMVLELTGIKNIVSKMLGSKNKINNVKATFEALKKLKAPKIYPAKKEVKKEEIKK
jgi:small subunit ribosomal protein S5